MKTEFSILLDHAAYTFCANHCITFTNQMCEPLHGHDFRVAVEIWGAPNDAGYVLDFLDVDRFLRRLVERWNHKTLLAGKSPLFEILSEGSQTRLRYTGPGNCSWSWSFPSEHCLTLDVSNTTTELLAQAIGRELGTVLASEPLATGWEVTLWEAPGCCARCRMTKEG